MTNISLYHAAQDVQNKIALCVDEDGVFDTDKLDMIEATFKDRAVAVVAVYKGKGHTIDTLKSYLTEIQAQIKREQANQERLKRDEVVEIDEGITFPAALCNDPKPPTPSKTKIKNAILAGEAVAGARIVRKDRLQIK